MTEKALLIIEQLDNNQIKDLINQKIIENHLIQEKLVEFNNLEILKWMHDKKKIIFSYPHSIVGKVLNTKEELPELINWLLSCAEIVNVLESHSLFEGMSSNKSPEKVRFFLNELKNKKNEKALGQALTATLRSLSNNNELLIELIQEYKNNITNKTLKAIFATALQLENFELSDVFLKNNWVDIDYFKNTVFTEKKNWNVKHYQYFEKNNIDLLDKNHMLLVNAYILSTIDNQLYFKEYVSRFNLKEVDNIMQHFQNIINQKDILEQIKYRQKYNDLMKAKVFDKALEDYSKIALLKKLDKDLPPQEVRHKHKI